MQFKRVTFRVVKNQVPTPAFPAAAARKGFALRASGRSRQKPGLPFSA